MPIQTLTSEADASLFLDFLDPNLSLLDITDRHEIALDDLLEWAESPDTRARLTRLHNLNTFRNSFLAAGNLASTLSSLTAAAARTPAPDADPLVAHRTAESARRAASQLARLATRPTPSRATDGLAAQTAAAPHASDPESAANCLARETISATLAPESGPLLVPTTTPRTRAAEMLASAGGLTPRAAAHPDGWS